MTNYFMIFSNKYIFRWISIFFCFVFLFNQKSSCQSASFSRPEYKKLVTYLQNGCSEVLPQLRKDSQMIMLMVKYYINSDGSIDSIVLSDDSYGRLKGYIKAMNRKLINWNKVLSPSPEERIAAIPFYIGPEKDNATGFNFANFHSTLSITKLFSFSQNPYSNFTERLYLMPTVFCIYITGNIEDAIYYDK